MIRFRRVGIVAAALFLAATTACDDAAGPDGDTVTIAMRDNQFDPTSRTVARGTTVRWVNQGSTAHNTRAATNAWQSDNLPPGEDFEVTLQNPGTYDYTCTLHQGMNGTIVVQ
jgi:plastocyanin